MFGLGTQELIIVMAIVIIIFGANKIPKLGFGLGKGISNFKKGINDNSDDEFQTLKQQDDNLTS